MSTTIRTSTYNPGILGKDELIATFAARGPLLATLLDDVRRGGKQHHLIIGQRGAGKTTLLLRVAYAIEDDPELAGRAVPLRFPEEQYNVGRPSDFWLNCVDALIDTLERRGDVAAARKLDAEVDRLEDLDEDDRAREGLALLTGWAKQAKRLLVLLVDNVDLVLDRLSGHHWPLREVLSADNRLMLIGASSAFIQESFSYGEAFYDFFHVHELASLSEDEARALLEHLADATGAPHVREVLAEPGRFAALHLMSGGMPRTLVLLHRILAAGTSARAEDDLEALLDQVTPYYKARFDELPAQSQLIVHALALHWHPMTAIECATSAHLDINTVSSQLNRLVRQGLLTKLPSADSAKLSFLIAERFFAIWYSMRASRRLRRKLLWLVEAIQTLYGQAEVERRAQELLASSDGAEAAGDPARLLAYAAKVHDPSLRSKLELRAVQRMVGAGLADGVVSELLDVDGEDSHLVPLLGRVQTLKEIRDRLRGSAVITPDPAAAAEWLVSNPMLSLAHKVRLSRDPERLQRFLDAPTGFLPDSRALLAAVAAGEVPSLADLTDERELKEITSLVAEGLRSWSASDETEPRLMLARMIVFMAIITFVAPYVRASQERTEDHHRSRWLLEQALRLQVDDATAVMAQPSIRLPLVKVGMAEDTAEALRQRGWQDRLLPIYEALRAAATQRLGDLVYLAPEVRKPTEQALSEFLLAGLYTGYPYERLVGTSSRAAEGKQSWLRSTADAVVTRAARAVVRSAVSAAGSAKPKQRRPKA